MPPDFLTPERKKIRFFGTTDLEKNTKKLAINNSNKIICAWYHREVSGEHTYLPKKIGISPVMIILN